MSSENTIPGKSPFVLQTAFRLIYAFSASGIGGIIGAVFGSWMFPLLISDAYGHLYIMIVLFVLISFGMKCPPFFRMGLFQKNE